MCTYVYIYLDTYVGIALYKGIDTVYTLITYQNFIKKGQPK